jgi:hypothetical protein
MHCIQSRPSARFFQTTSIKAAEKERGDSPGTSVPPSPKSGASGNNSWSGGTWLLSKDERIAHVESTRSIVVTVVIPKDVLGHVVGGEPSAILPDVVSRVFASGDTADPPASPHYAKGDPSSSLCTDMELVLCLPSNANVSQAVGSIFETWMDLRCKTGRPAQLHDRSLYRKIGSEGTAAPLPSGGDSAPTETMLLALLQMDLTLGICDAAGHVIQPLKRLYNPKPGVTVPVVDPVKLPSTPTVSQVAHNLQVQHCLAIGRAPSQKSLLSILSSFVPPPNTAAPLASSSVAPGEAALSVRKSQRSVATGAAWIQQDATFQPPFYLKLFVPAERKAFRRLQLQEMIFRERLMAQAFVFLTHFAVPYYREILSCDVSLRADWILYQSHCRHRLHIHEREERIRCQQGVVFREEAALRVASLQEEDIEREVLLGHTCEQLMFMACAEASRHAGVASKESMMRVTITQLFQRDTQNMLRLLETMSQVTDFLNTLGNEMEETTRLEMLREYHSAVKHFR